MMCANDKAQGAATPRASDKSTNQCKADRNYSNLKARVKHAVCLLALWGLITPKTATAILKALGVRHA